MRGEMPLQDMLHPGPSGRPERRVFLLWEGGGLRQTSGQEALLWRRDADTSHR